MCHDDGDVIEYVEWLLFRVLPCEESKNYIVYANRTVNTRACGGELHV